MKRTTSKKLLTIDCVFHAHGTAGPQDPWYFGVDDGLRSTSVGGAAEADRASSTTATAARRLLAEAALGSRRGAAALPPADWRRATRARRTAAAELLGRRPGMTVEAKPPVAEANGAALGRQARPHYRRRRSRDIFRLVTGQRKEMNLIFSAFYIL